MSNYLNVSGYGTWGKQRREKEEGDEEKEKLEEAEENFKCKDTYFVLLT